MKKFLCLVLPGFCSEEGCGQLDSCQERSVMQKCSLSCQADSMASHITGEEGQKREGWGEGLWLEAALEPGCAKPS